jgi:subtilisin family serine protease
MADLPVVVYNGGRAGYPATAPRRGEHANPNSAQVRKYQDFLNRSHTAALRAVGASSTAKFYDYTFSFNGFAAQLTPAQAAKLAQQPNVVSVQPEELRQPMTDNTPAFLGLSAPGGVWEQLGGQESAGEDVIIGVIDTGIWPEHPSFSDEVDLGHDPGSTDRNLAYGPPPAHWHGKCESGEQFSQQDCNNKLIGARWFTRGRNLAAGQHEGEYASPRDRDGHGTHTASTAGGNADVHATIFGRELGPNGEPLSISGMAPRARIAAYKGCFGETGCFLTDLLAAIDAAVSDGVDVINYSIGSDNPAFGDDDIAFLFAAAAGVYVATSAGNAGPGVGTVGSPASAPWVTAVGASTHSRYFLSTITLGDGNGTFQGGSVGTGLDETRLVDATFDPTGAAGEVHTYPCVEGGLDPEVVAGAIVLCERKTGIARISHGAAVAAAGGVGMILFDPPQVNVRPTDNHLIPTVHVHADVAGAIEAYIEAAGDDATASFSGGSAQPNDDPDAPSMAVFSSRGPNGAAPDIIKPDVTAPGVQILAGNSPNPFLGAPGELFQAIQGTSMSSPHVAGVGALLRDAHPDWTPAMIKSALMTTAGQDVSEEDWSTAADPFDMGGGHIQPNPATDPGLVYDAGFLDYVAFLCGNGSVSEATCTQTFGIDPIDPSDLNLASIGIAQLAGTQTVTRTVTNVGDGGVYTVSVDEPPGVNVDVDPAVLDLGPGASATYSLKFTSEDDAVFDQWTFGSLTWSDTAGHNVRSPIAVVPVPISAPDEVSGTGTTGSLEYEVQFGYNGPFATPVHGLVAADVIHDTVVDDPASDIVVALDTGVGVNEYTIPVAADTRHLRISLFDETVDGATDDIDLYLYPPGEDPFNGGTASHVSAGGTSAEQIDVATPEEGDWTLIVHGWQTDGADAVFDLFTWDIPDDDAGNLAATSSTAVASVGDTATITLEWGTGSLTPLAPSTRYLGVVGYSNGVTEFGGTIVSIVT